MLDFAACINVFSNSHTPKYSENNLLLLFLLLLLHLLLPLFLLLLLIKCSTTFFQLSLFCASFFQLCTFMLFISSKTSSSQHVLGLPIGLLDMCFPLLIFCTILSSAMCSTWPNQFNLCFLINPIIFCPFNISFIVKNNQHSKFITDKEI